MQICQSINYEYILPKWPRRGDSYFFLLPLERCLSWICLKENKHTAVLVFTRLRAGETTSFAVRPHWVKSVSAVGASLYIFWTLLLPKWSALKCILSGTSITRGQSSSFHLAKSSAVQKHDALRVQRSFSWGETWLRTLSSTNTQWIF